MVQARTIQRETATRDWAEVLDAYDVRFLVLDAHNDSELVDLFWSQSEWAIDFEDQDTVIFARVDEGAC